MTPQFDTDGQLALGEPAPDFNLPGTDGNTYHLDSYRGKAKAVCIIFSCNHCPYVIKSEERIMALGREYQPKGVQFLLVGPNNDKTHPQDSFENMKIRAREKGYPFPYLRDESQDAARNYGAKTTPHVFLFDGDLKLRYRGAIDDNVDDPRGVKVQYLRDALDEILAGQPQRITTPKTKPVGCSIKWK